jgi:hypothetical protein
MSTISLPDRDLQYHLSGFLETEHPPRASVLDAGCAPADGSVAGVLDHDAVETGVSSHLDIGGRDHVRGREAPSRIPRRR